MGLFEWLRSRWGGITASCSIEPEYSLGGSKERQTITGAELRALDYTIQSAWVREWVCSIQLGCPYCERIQTNSTALDVMLSPKDYWLCEYPDCGKIIGVLEGKKT